MRYVTSLAFTALLFLTACANLETNAFKVLGTTAVTVDTAMSGWGEYVRAGKASATDETVVRQAYERYQIAMATAQQAVATYQVSRDKKALDIALDVLDTVKNTLIDTITNQKYKL